MKKSATLRFALDVVSSYLRLFYKYFFPGFLALILILFAVGFCIQQWYRRTRELKDQIDQEQKILLEADQYISARFQ